MSLIRITDLSFAYQGSFETVFDKVSMELDTDWKLGSIGRNGRGKTTFLRLLGGQLHCSGRIHADVDFEYFPFEITDMRKSVETIIDELLHGDWQRWALVRELSLLDIGEEVLQRPFAMLSHGQRTKVMLAALFLKSNGFLLIDEPTDHLDMAGREMVGRYLNEKRGFILVSHDRHFLNGCIDHILSINKQSIDVQKGNFATWQQNKTWRNQHQMKRNDRLKKEIRRLSNAADQSARWSDKAEKTKFGTKNAGLKPDKGYVGHKSAKMMKKARRLAARRRNALEEKAGLLGDIDDADALKIHSMPFHSKRLVEFDGVSLFYGEHQAAHCVSLSIHTGDRIALCGKNGTGKTSILRLIANGDIRHTGNFHRASGLVISYVPQDTSFLVGRVADYARVQGVDQSLFQTILRKLGFPRLQFEMDIAGFSAGQKKKVLIAKSLSEKANLYVWDEPLNYIDVLSRMQIEDLLMGHEPTMIFVEHDRAFVHAVANTVIEL